VYNTQVRPYAGNLYNIDVYGASMFNIEVTEEHPFVCVKREKARDRNKKWDTEWLTTKDLKKSDYLAVPRNKVLIKKEIHEFIVKSYNPKVKSFEDKGVEVKLVPEFFKLAGFYLAEGSISKGSYLNFSFNKNELDLVQEVESMMQKCFGLKSYRAIHNKNNGVNVVFSSVEVCRIFEHFGTKSYTKKLPEWMLFEDPIKQKEIIKAVFKGDGNYYLKTHKSGLKESFRINTTSRVLALQLQDILIRLGVFAFVNCANRKLPRRPIYTVGITGEFCIEFGNLVGVPVSTQLNDKKRASMFFIDEDYAYLPIKNIETQEVKDISVYNFSVQDHESYVVAGVAVHNCSAPKYGANALHAGCVEVYVGESARARYSSVENWSKDTYNLNTKRAIVQKNAVMEWIGGNMGSGVTMLYPCSMLVGEGAHADHLGVAFANAGQVQDTGAKIVHAAPHTSSKVVMKSLSKGGGIAMYRGLLQVNPNAHDVTSNVECDALILDDISRSDTVPDMKIYNNDVTIAHEATAGKLNDDDIFYLTSRGIDKEAAKAIIVNGFIEPIVKELPMEYAVEMNRLIEMEMEGSVG
jgi:Fe-S cluster assembly protein SufB